MTEAGWTHGKDLSAEGQSFMASVKVLIDAIEQEAYQQGRAAGLREACIAVSQFSSDGVPINADELRIALVQLLGSLAQQAQGVQLTKEDNHG